MTSTLHALSAAQLGIWFDIQVRSNNSAYNIGEVIEIEGAVDPVALETAIRAVIASTAALRVQIAIRDGAPVQVLQQALPFELITRDFSIAVDAEHAALNWMEAELRRPFDLASAPLFRHVLVKLGPARFYWVSIYHHLIIDGYGMSVVARQVARLYSALIAGQPLTPRTDRFLEFLQDDASYGQSAQRAADREYWRSQQLELHARPSPAARLGLRNGDPDIHRATVVLPESFTIEARSVGRALRITLPETLIGLCAIAFHRITGEWQVPLGVMLHGRSNRLATRVVTNCTNLLPVHLHVDPGASVQEVLLGAREKTRRDFKHQHYRWEDIIRDAGLVATGRSPVRMAVNLVQFDYDLRFGEATSRVRNLSPGPVDDLSIYLDSRSADGSMAVHLDANSSIYEAWEARSLSSAFVQLMEASVVRASHSVRSIPAVPQAQRTLLQDQWNATTADYPRERCIHELFELQVAQTPEAIALIHEDQRMSYRELNARANQLAARLRQLGVRPGERVALCLDRGVEMVVALLGILKAGGAYVPLDPAYPAERLRYMLRDAAPRALLTQAGLRDALSKLCTSAIVLDMACPEMARQSATNVRIAASGESARFPAYVIYTSGSTGTPKGVIVEHRGVVNFLLSMQRQLRLGMGDRVLALTTLSFDIAALEIYLPLLAGAQVVVGSRAVATDGGLLAQMIDRYAVTVLQATPATWRLLLAAGWEGRLSLTALCGGEALPVDLSYRLSSRVQALWNLYGPTETTIWSSGQLIESALARQWDIEPIGRPIANTRIHILDAQGEPVPVGVAGEIAIAGDGVACGFLNRGELTAERFVPDPFSVEAGARVYRSGDLGRYRADGVIEYLGRMDEQVKIRGFRIEPGEIQACLLEHKGVREAVVLVREDAPGERRLVAYYTPRAQSDSAHASVNANDQNHPPYASVNANDQNHSPFASVSADDQNHSPLSSVSADDQGHSPHAPLSAEVLRAHLSSLLPEHMVPVAYVQLEQFPLTPNGKLDRKALPAPEGAAYVAREYAAPVGEVEQTLARIWSQVLGCEPIGRHSHFLELGGHSLLAMSVIERMRQVGLHTDVRTLLTQPTLAGLAAAVSSESASIAVPPSAIPADAQVITPEMLPLMQLSTLEIERIVASVPGGVANIQDIYPLVPLQEGILFHYRFSGEQRSGEGDPYLRHALVSFESREKLESYLHALQAVIDRHDILRTAVLWDGLSEPVQVVWRRAPLVIEEVRLNASGANAAEQLLKRIDPHRYRLDVRHAPLMRIFIGKDRGKDPGEDVARQRWVMLQMTHHLAADNTTLEVMQQEIGRLLLDRTAALPVPLQFRNFVAHLRSRADHERHEAFFRKLLGDVEEPTTPFGLSDIRGDGSQTTGYGREVDADLARRLQACARTHGVSAASLFHLASALVLGRVSGRDDVVFGTVLFGRTQGAPGADQILGLFVNTLPLRLRLDEQSVQDSVLATHALLADLLRHEHASLALARRCSQVMAPTPLFSAVLNYRHVANQQPHSGETARGWQGIELLHGEERSNYPFLLTVDDRGEAFSIAAQVCRPLDPERVCAFMHTALERLADALERAPESPVRSIDVLPELERHRLLVQWNASAESKPPVPFVHEWFEAQVQATPDAVALVCEEQRLDYAELNRRANRLAHYLRGLGVGPDTRVAICLARGIDMVVGLLAVLKAGGAYVPMDPAYPQARLAYMLADSRPIALLTQTSLADLWMDYAADFWMVLLDSPEPPWSHFPDSDPDRSEAGLSASHLAYVIYTSGSTGQPKGVMIEHSGLVSYLQWALRAYEPHIGVGSVVASSLAFDATVTSLFTPLLCGRRVVLLREGDEIQGLQHALSQPVEWSLIKISPAHLSALGQSWRSGGCSVRAFVIGGEALPLATVRLWQSISPHVRLINEYGPTETVVGCCTYEIPGEGVASDLVPIGRPISNTQIYILDGQGRAAPIGVAGEIYIGGAGVARGYLHRAALTAERFVPDEHSAEHGARLYRTGDLGRYRADGQIEFLGRNDHQVKLRGYRIEPGEIEARLSEHAAVSEAVVLMREGATNTLHGRGRRENAERDAPGEKRLVAYYTPKARSESAHTRINAEVLRTHLSSVLPEHMVPAAYVQLEQFPLTPNGKLDRKALPAPEGAAYVAREHEAPIGEVESTLARIWSQALGHERIGRQDNFFELGGHSLLAVSVIAQMQQAGLHADVRTLFTLPTLAGWAAAFTIPTLTGWAIAEHRESGFAAVPPNGIPSGCEAITPQMVPLAQLSAAEVECIVASVPGGASNIQDIYPLAPLQEGILFHHLLSGESDPYLVNVLLGFDGRESLQRYLDALQTVIDRHDILRTAVLWEGLNEPVQVVWRRAPLVIEHVPLDEAGADIADRLYERVDPRRYRLDVRQAPLTRVFITQDVARGRWLMLQVLHNLSTDHTTLEVMQQEIQALLRGRAADLPEPLPFRNFVAQARFGVRREEHEEFFRNMLADVQEPTTPFGLIDVHGDGTGLTECRVPVDADLGQRLRARARALGVSAASLFHLAFAQVLSRASGRTDVIFGTVLFGRMQSGTGADRTLGLFINTLPVRIRLDEQSVQESVRHTHYFLAQLLRHEHASLALAQRCSAVAAPAPLFSALLNYRYLQHIGPGLTENILAAEGIEILRSEERSNYPINLDVDDLGTGFALTAQVRVPLDPERVCAFMHTALEQLAEALEWAPATPVRDLDVLPKAERRQLLVQWNDTGALYPRDQCVHELFEAQAAQAPRAIALVHEDRQINYAELNARANQLAAYLRERGVRPDDRVALCVERSIEMVVGLLAILKAGGAYVPLDASYPAERLTYMLKDSAPVALLTHAQGSVSVREQLRDAAVPLIDLHADAHRWSDQPKTDLPRTAGLTPEHLAYVIYTSGSTGQPNAVMIGHRALCSQIAALRTQYGLTAADRLLQFASPAFDVSLEEIFGALLCGAALILRTPECAQGASELEAFCRAHAVSVANLPSQFWQVLAQNEAVKLPDCLRQIVIGSDTVSAQALAAWFERDDDLPCLFNAYGLTETTINATVHELSARDAGTQAIGRPIANTQIYILDGQGRAAPIGVAGEIHIGGAGVARGYLNRAALTAERFVPDPYSAEGGARLYRSGDLGRYRTDGAIEFLGRVDDQVKIRGFRIEPGEIQACLLKHAGVREAAVLARDDVSGEKRLVAYYTPKAHSDSAHASVNANDQSHSPHVSVSAEVLRAHLSVLLPEHMVPAAYVQLEQFPLTPNGKLDRKALPVPEGIATSLSGRYEAPIGEVESTLARIWSQALGHERIGRHDNFFELGGHSLLAIRLIERMRQAGLHTDVRALFATPTLAALAAAVRGESHLIAVPPNGIRVDSPVITPEMVPLVKLSADEIGRIIASVPGGVSNIQDIYPLAPLQEGILFHHLLASEGDPYLLHAVVSFDSRERVRGYLDALQAVIDRHDILRTAVLWEGLSEPVQVVWRRAPLVVEEVTLDAKAGDAAEQLRARFDPRRYRLDVRQAPLTRVFVAHDAANQRWLMLQLSHHLSADHTAVDLIHEEVQEYLLGRAASLPAPLPFRNFVAQARLGVSREEHEAFFRPLLGDVEEPTTPFGLSDVRGDGSQITEARQHLEPRLAHRLRARARALGVSAASLFHLAFAQLLSRASDRDDVVFGTVLFGRMQGGEGADRVLGLFINTLPVRIRLGADSVQDSVRHTHQLLAQLLRHEHASLALAQRCSAVAAPAPLFSALLNYRYEVQSVQAAAQSARAWEGIEFLQGEERTNYPFVLAVDDRGVEFELTAQIRSPVDPVRICGLMHAALEHLADALERIPTHPVRSVDVLPAAERHQLLVQWNATEAACPLDRCIHELFEIQAARAPESLALVHEEQRLTYGELNTRANRLAAGLRRLGVKPQQRVALLLERSMELILAQLAVLKCGAAYVPLDPGAPPDRQTFLIEDCAASHVLSARGLKWPERCMARVLILSELNLDSESASNSSLRLGSEATAYVMYTSGSTGQPKGVLVPHRGIARLVVNNGYADFRASDRVAFVGNPAFDISTLEVWAPLLHGGCVVIVDQASLLDAAALSRLLDKERVNVLHLVAGLLSSHIDALAGILPRLRYLLTGGDVVDPRAVSRVLRECSPQRLIHCYGPTETTTFATTHHVSAIAQGAKSIPIGRPISNTCVYILDRHTRPAPVGIAGEIYIGGAGVAQGYLNRPELTAERFQPDPFARQPGSRMYRTGDLGRWLTDGTIEFIGRNDRQIKIRGHRVEPAEIEAALLSHESVQQAAVLLREDSAGDKRLVAYVSAASRVELWPSIAEHLVYDEFAYAAMAAHEERNRAYAAAFARQLKDATVVEIGTGPEAVLARLAITAGARKVFAIELLEDAFERATETVRRLGLQDRIAVLRGDATQIDLPEKVDYCISEIVGNIGGSEGAAYIINNARRFLRHPGNMIPHRSVTKIAAVSLTEDLFDYAFNETASQYVERIFEQAGGQFDLRISLKGLPADAVLSSADVFEDLHFASHVPLEADHEISLVFGRDGVLTGFLVWLVLSIDEHSALDTLTSHGSWVPNYLPAFPAGLPVNRGDRLKATVVRCLSDDGVHPDFCIQGTLLHADGRSHIFRQEVPHRAREFRGSPFYQKLFANGGLAIRSRLSAPLLREYLNGGSSALAGRLPDYMMPSAIVVLDQFPLTANGKVDRKALPAPEGTASSMRAYEAPVGEVERTIERIWCEVLRIERVGRHDQFFELGGHSLLAVSVIERMRQAGLHADVRTLFATPRLAELSAIVGRRSGIVDVPPNRIPSDCEAITPEMLPLVQLSAEDIERIVSTVPGGARNVQDIYPLAPLQEGILFHYLLAEEGDPYLLHALASFDTHDRVQRYLSALQAVIDRHDILRTAVLWEGLSEPVQVVWRHAPLAVEQVTLDPGAGDLPEQLRKRFDPRQYRMDVRHAPLRKVVIAQDAANGRWLLLQLWHHLSGDHTAVDVMQREIQAHLLDRAQELPAPLPFRDFIARARLGVSREEQETFFRQLLGDVREPTTPFGLSDVRGDGSHISEFRCEVAAGLAQRLRSRAGMLGVSAASLFHLAYALVLSRVASRNDVVFGTLLFGRTQAEGATDRSLGVFINTLPVRIEVGERSVQESVRHTHHLLAQLLGHEHASLALAQRCSAVPAPAPLFSALLNYRYIGAGSDEATHSWEGIEFLGGEERTNYPFVIAVDDTGAGFELTAQVSRSHDAQRMCAFMHQAVEQLIGALERTPAMPIRSVDVLPAAERRQLLVQWNDTATADPSDCSVHELFEAQVERSPDAIALVYEDQSVRYGELNARANQLARYLRKQGVRPDDRVAICVERSVEMVVGLLGILKSGAAYVPLDASYPAERLSYMLKDSTPVALLTHSQLPTTVLEHLRAIDLQADAYRWADESPSNLDRHALGLSADHLAYVIYTSGSTGRPKGVMVTREALSNHMLWMARAFELARDEVVLQKTPISFDASVWEILAPLLSGARLVLAAEQGHKDADYLCEIIAHTGVTRLQLVPSMLRALLQHPHIQACASLRHVFSGGEPLTNDLRERLLERLPSAMLHNLYGPTETCIQVVVHSCEKAITTAEGSVPIGRPISNTSLYVLDEWLEPVPVGVSGELYIGGRSLARGYWGRADLTAERFVPDPFGFGQRLYRSGDRVRYRADGTLEFLSRVDDQAKIRGFRIEPGEIQACLLEHAGVREAAVLVREDVPGEKRLVAYYTPKAHSDSAHVSVNADDQSHSPYASVNANDQSHSSHASVNANDQSYSPHAPVNAEVLRAHLSSVLPEHMVPAAYVQLEQFPLTPNGKLDRQALPAPDGAAYVAREYEAPIGEVEQTLARIWIELLKLERVSRHDNFFELGGHSLLAIRLIERMRQAELHADVRTLFTTPALAGLAAAVVCDGKRLEVPPSLITPDCDAITPEMLPLVQLSAPEIERIAASVPGGAANIQDIYPLAPLQEGILFHHLLSGESDPYLLHALVSFDSRDRLQSYLSALQSVIDRHDILRTGVLWEGLSEPVQVVWRRAPLVIEEVTLDAGAADSAEQLRARFDPRRYRLDVRQAPLTRVFIAHDVEQQRWLMLQLSHHLSTDHTTLEVMQEEIQAHLLGQQAKLPQSLPFRNFVAQARLGVSREEHEAFFRPLLSDVQEPTTPFGLSDVHGDGSQISETHQELDPHLARRLRARARALGVSAASLFHLAFALVLGRTAGRDDVVFGTVLFGRMQGGEGADRALGLFINTLPVRIRVQDEGVQSSVHRTHELLAELLKHEHASLALAQRCSAVAAPTPLFSALLNYRYAVEGDQEAAQIAQAWEGIEFLQDEERTNYPLLLSVNDFGDDLSLTAQVRAPVSPERVCLFMQQALEQLVDALERAPAQSVRAIDVLPDSERQQLLVQWNATDALYPRDLCIHELFEAQVERVPQAMALVHENQYLTYAELNARSNRLAHYLRKLGVKPDARVGLCVERGVDMVVGLLGVLKAGGAYVPLDASYPAERLTYMLRDSAPAVVLTHARVPATVRESLALAHAVPLIDLQADANDWSREPDANPARYTAGLTAEHLAYVIYTSGSSGQPKAVAIAHRNTVNLLSWSHAAFSAQELKHTLFATSLNFDLAIYECLAPLTSGASVEIVRDALAAADTLTPISLINTVPSALSALLDSDEIEPSVRTVNLAGEALQRSVVERLFAQSSVQRVCNLYGPSETTTYSTWVSMSREEGFLEHIGRPIANTRIYILDAQARPAPIGMAGEICIGGAGVARGYLQRPELTAERFVPDAFAREAGARMYQTGDRGRWLPDGTLEFLGRQDHQVKMRGFRIELGEIEARLAEHAGVRDAIVRVQERDGGEKRLVAYYTQKSQTDGSEWIDVSAEALRSHLSASLPEYMVPAAYVQLDAMPLTPSGKVDRKALPEPDETAYAVGDYEAPVGAVENTLARIWIELLQLDRVGRRDNFFELGGHSLLAIRMTERMRQEGLHADVRSLFSTPVLADLAVAVGGESRLAAIPPNLIPPDCDAITPEMLPLVKLSAQEIERIVATVRGGARNIQDIYPLAMLQEGILFHHLMAAEGDPYLLYGLVSFDSWERAQRYLRALQAVIDRHDILRTAVVWEWLSEPVQVVWRHAPMLIEQVTLDPAAGDIAEQLRTRFNPRQYRVDVRQAPLIRIFAAEDVVNRRWVVMQLAQHLSMDHTALEVMQQEIQAFLLGRTDKLQEPLPFRSFVAQTRLGVSREEHEAFFGSLLGDVREPTTPFGLTNVHGDGSEIAQYSRGLDANVARRLRMRARLLGISAASLFHLAFALVLSRAAGRDDVVFGTVLFGRTHGGEGADRALGLFINTLPVRIRVQDEGVQSSVQRTHELLAKLLKHEHVSLALAQRCSAVVAPTPLFSALLNYRHSGSGGEHQPYVAEAWEGIEFLDAEERTNYPFVISVDDTGAGYDLTAQVSRSHDAQRMCAFMHQAVEQLIGALERTPAMPIRSVDVLPAAERRQLLVQWNDTATAYPSDCCVHELFEAQVERTPDAIALVYEDQSIRYGELNARANRLARYLRKQGVRPDDRVAICVERSVEMIVGLLGILKSGAAYVPLDASYPAERLSYMLKDSTPVALLTHSQLPATVREQLRATLGSVALYRDGDAPGGVPDHSAADRPGIGLIDLQADAHRWADESPSNLDRHVLRLSADHLAYVIYTSGSTGRPKGVMVTREALSNHMLWMARAFELAPDEVVLQKTPISFDASVWEILAPLLSGARLVLAAEQGHKDADYLCEIIARTGVTRLQLVPSMLRAILQHPHIQACASLRHVFSGGEPLTNDLRERLLERLPSATLHNLYGPTETCIQVVVHSCEKAISTAEGSVPIGRPISNTALYVLDEWLEPVPVGVAGELYIGGRSLARGYWGRADLTAERFVPDPFGFGQRLYRSGDRVRYRADGTLEFLSRVDDQAKIRGFRIEPAEIEMRLLEHPGVREAVVLVREGATHTLHGRRSAAAADGAAVE